MRDDEFEELERRRASMAAGWKRRPDRIAHISQPLRKPVELEHPGQSVVLNGEVYLEELRRKGPYRCATCGEFNCELPGICDSCAVKQKEQEREAAVQKTLRSLPKSWQWANFRNASLFQRLKDHSAVKSSADMLRRLVAGQSWLVVLAGESGEGKTSTAAAMMRYCAEKDPGRMMFFVYAPRIARAYRNSPLGSTPELIDRCERTWLLVIDDLGADAVYRDSLREVIQVREAERKPTIITTYLTETEARDAYGGGISRRMYRDGCIVWFGGVPNGVVPPDAGTKNESLGQGGGSGTLA